MIFNGIFQLRGKDMSDFNKIMAFQQMMLDCISYVFPKGLRIKSVYSTDETVKSTGIKFPPYGNMVSYELYYNDRRIFRVKGENSPYIGYTMILEALQDRLSMDTQIIEQSDNSTVINESFSNDFNAISEYKFLLAPVEHTAYDGEEKYTAHTYIENAKADANLLKMHFQLGHWYFGHFHVDLELWRNQTAVLSCVRELETGRIVRQWD